jgi:hypothetical protein
MGYEAKRVARDFDWPLHKRWPGHINPFDAECIPCSACISYAGFSPAMAHLRGQWDGAVSFSPEDRGSIPYRATDEVVIRTARSQMGATASSADEQTVARQTHLLCEELNSKWRYHLSAEDVAVLDASGYLVDFIPTRNAMMGSVPKDPPDVPTPRELNDAAVAGRDFDEGSKLFLFIANCERVAAPVHCPKCEVRSAKGVGVAGRLSNCARRPDAGCRSTRLRETASRCGTQPSKVPYLRYSRMPRPLRNG